MTIEFTPLTVLIGGNSCGKSTVLQALDFLHSVSFRDIPEYLREKGWKIEELKSQLNGGQDKPIEFIALFGFMIENQIETIQWTFIVNQNNGSWNIKEEIIKSSNNAILFSRGFGRGGPIVAGDPGAYAGSPIAAAHDISEILLESSWLKYLQMVNEKPELIALKQFLTETTFFGLISPDSIRQGDKSKVADDIGTGGISVASFVSNMLDEQRKLLDKMVSDLVGFSVRIRTINLGGKIELYIDEKYDVSSTRVNKDHISDGLLRIIAFVAISLQRKHIIHQPTGADITPIKNGFQVIIGTIESPHGIILLDEIENGINPYLTEKVIKLLHDIVNNLGRQVIITTHSPLIIDDINPEEIIFLWKDDTGAVHCKKMFETDEMKELLNALYPGEVWVNLDTNNILKRLNIKTDEKAPE
jgi:predicted ATPase